MKNVVMFSSGLDSAIAYYCLDKTNPIAPTCVHVHGHSRYSRKELSYVYKLLLLLDIPKIEFVDQKFLSWFEESDANIPGRNALFAQIGAYYGDNIHIVCQEGEQSIPDRSPEFFSKMSEVLTLLWGKKKVVNPTFADLTKQEMVGMALEAGIDKKILLSTYSCFNGKDPGRCGKCAACARTAIAFEWNNIELEIDFFSNNIWEWDGWESYRFGLESGKYSGRRGEQIRSVLKKKNLI